MTFRASIGSKRGDCERVAVRAFLAGLASGLASNILVCSPEALSLRRIAIFSEVSGISRRACASGSLKRADIATLAFLAGRCLSSITTTEAFSAVNAEAVVAGTIRRTELTGVASDRH